MKLMYKVNYGYDEIEEVDVIRETAHFVVISWKGWHGQRERKEKKEGVYFDTWDLAWTFLKERWNARIKNAESQVDYAKEKLRTVLALKEKGADHKGKEA